MWDYVLWAIVGLGVIYLLVRFVLWRLFRKERYKG